MLLMTVVVPEGHQDLRDMKATLPWTTRLLIFISNALQDWWFIIFPAADRRGRRLRLLDGAARRASRCGTAFVLKAPGRSAAWCGCWPSPASPRTLATLLKSGVPLLTAMDIVKNVITNSVLAEVVEKARDAIREGESIAAR